MHSQYSVGLPIFRSDGQARLLTALMLDETATWRSLSDLGRRTDLAPSSVMREVDRLEAAGLVETERVGNVRRVRADRNSRFHPEIRGLLLKAYGPEPVLRDALAAVEGVHRAYLFGSWARRVHDPAGGFEEPRDLDLLVVGDPVPDEVYRVCAAAERRLGLAIDPAIVTEEQWADGTDDAPLRGFLAAVRADAPIELFGDAA